MKKVIFAALAAFFIAVAGSAMAKGGHGGGHSASGHGYSHASAHGENHSSNGVVFLHSSPSCSDERSCEVEKTLDMIAVIVLVAIGALIGGLYLYMEISDWWFYSRNAQRIRRVFQH